MTATMKPPASHRVADTQRHCAGRVSNTPEDHLSVDAHSVNVFGDPNPSSSHVRGDTQERSAVAGPIPPPTKLNAKPRREPSAGTKTPAAAKCAAAPIRPPLPLDQISPPPREIPNPSVIASAGTKTTTSSHPTGDTQRRCAAGGSNPDGSPGSTDTHETSALVGPNSPAPTGPTAPKVRAAQGLESPDGHRKGAAQITAAVRGPILRDPFLSLLAENVDDLERVRIATENRYRALTRSVEDSDGELRGLGLSDDIPEVARVRQVVDGLATLEHQAVLNLQRQIRKHPLWKAWGKDAKGVGEKQLARLLAAIGDPYWNDLHNRRRQVSELWAYCGFHVIDGQAAKRAKGAKVNWSTTARMRAFLITEACLKAQGHYADVYYAAREKYADATHNAECVRCGPKGKPAVAGSPLSLAHQHARALRAIAKEVLKDLWLTARDIHQEETS